jgi:hypothetical protein
VTSSHRDRNETRMQFTYVETVKVRPGHMDEILRKVEAELLPLYRQAPGFVAYTIAKTDEVSATALSIWQTRQQAEHARKIREEWEKEETAAAIASFHNAVGSLAFLAITPELVGFTSVMPAAASRHA